jgi:hypothetical protein
VNKSSAKYISSLALIFGLAGASVYSHAAPVALTPATAINVSTGSGTGSGLVGTGHEIFSFDAYAGDSISLDINVTQIFAGTAFTDDDSQLFLFNSSGQLLAQNDDFGGLQSFIGGFAIGVTDTYYVGVTTFDNDPAFSGGIISGWADNGQSRFAYDLVISGVTPAQVPEPMSLALVFTALLAAGIGKRLRRS